MGENEGEKRNKTNKWRKAQQHKQGRLETCVIGLLHSFACCMSCIDDVLTIQRDCCDTVVLESKVVLLMDTF